MHSNAHWEALVMALEHKKIPSTHTPKQMVNSLMESPLGTIMFTDYGLPLEGRDHHKALFIKVQIMYQPSMFVL